MNNSGAIAQHFKIKGRVQGVGFRPFIYRLAHRLHLSGSVYNQPDGVTVHIEGRETDCKKFLELLAKEAPAGAVIKSIEKKETKLQNTLSFTILPSRKQESAITEISPDIAVCPDCLKELYNKSDRRKDYPFINCTNCGPRFTLINDFPYDRQNTTMQVFAMCPDCDKEYSNPLDRRFHAQPISCPSCGPHYTYLYRNEILEDFAIIIQKIGEQINHGNIVSLKGLGGYNLACDALNPKAVNDLRQFKKREKKPFAIMFRSMEDLKTYAPVSGSESEILQSWRRPIVILEKLNTEKLAPGITTGLHSIGAFLPYLPLHYLLFDELRTNALVLTSGNESEVPILYTEDKARQVFKDISGGILMNNRPIARRADDSVVKVIDGSTCIMRRARGYTPDPVDLHFDAEGILATGAELSNCFCIGKDKQGILSQHIGDLKNAETYEFYQENIAEFSRMYRFKPVKVACDLHPDYLSTQYARQLNMPLIEVQHHHAHIAAVMAECGLDERVIGICYDGTGFGTDGNTWGSEILVADYSSFERISHFEYIPIPGGDMATREPWRSALAYLYQTYRNEWQSVEIPFLEKININKAGKLITAIEKGINSPLICSAGRLFDAVSALTELCIESNYHAEAPMRLEDVVDKSITDYYSIQPEKIFSFRQTIREIINDIHAERSVEEIATKFHNTIVKAAYLQVQDAFEQTGIKKVIVSGGTFQNRYLTEKLLHLLRQKDFEVFYPREVPCNDGGIALGQLAVAAHKKTE